MDTTVNTWIYVTKKRDVLFYNARKKRKHPERSDIDHELSTNKKKHGY